MTFSNLRLQTIAILIAVLVGSLGALQAAEAQTVVAGTNAWTFVATPTPLQLEGEPSLSTSFANHLGVNVTGIVIMVIRSNSSQTLDYSASTVTIASNGIGSAYDVAFGLSPGTYNATVFVMSFSGVAISTSDSVLFRI